jgi:6-phosphogluconolactonase
MTTVRREVLADADAVAARAAELLIEVCAAKKKSDPISVALSGGSTPKRLYQRLASPACRDRLPWDRVHWFWGDERFVPADHIDSNQRLVREALLDHVPVPPELVHPMTTVPLRPEDAAESYERELRSWYGGAELDPLCPLFDVNFLGIGEDGHTASLFPQTAALREHKRWAVAVPKSASEMRLSLSFPALNSSRLAVMLVVGEAKRAVLDQLAHAADLPAQGIRPVGELVWLLDRAAAGA